ncbi:monovalent cation/H(+) antiporter subunit G [Streptomyces sp. 8N114]|uniref:monovalent cation/H(+) antiporter subunit G n=1 Tax=Streptomyces sp. 8N114 TaxID=3457419 RepID=UPI003FD62939
MSWIVVADAAGALCMLAGAVLCLLAGIGLLRLPDVLTRMHAATKPQSFGLLLVLIGAGLWLRSPIDLCTLLLVGLFQLLTAPVAAHMVGRAAYRTGRLDREDLVHDELEAAMRTATARDQQGPEENPRSGG